MAVNIRKIEPTDNPQMERIIKSVFIEFKLPLSGTAYEDVETTQMFEAYQNKGDIYYVIGSFLKLISYSLILINLLRVLKK